MFFIAAKATLVSEEWRMLAQRHRHTPVKANRVFQAARYSPSRLHLLVQPWNSRNLARQQLDHSLEEVYLLRPLPSRSALASPSIQLLHHQFKTDPINQVWTTFYCYLPMPNNANLCHCYICHIYYQSSVKTNPINNVETTFHYLCHLLQIPSLTMPY